MVSKYQNLILFDRSNCKLNEPFKTSYLWQNEKRKSFRTNYSSIGEIHFLWHFFLRKRPVVKNVFLSNHSRKTSIYSQRSLFKIPQNTKLHTSLPLAAKVFLVQCSSNKIRKTQNDHLNTVCRNLNSQQLWI